MSGNNWPEVAEYAQGHLLDSSPAKRIEFIETLPSLQGKLLLMLKKCFFFFTNSTKIF